MAIKFSSKAKTLLEIEGKLSSANIAPMHIFTVAEWKSNKNSCLEPMDTKIGEGPWIVRSSSSKEDSSTESHAGEFLSLQNVNKANLIESINEVISSYGDPENSDEVLIQPMLSNVKMSGVVFSHDPNTCSPYRVINWSDGPDTNLVTSGESGKLWFHAANSPYKAPSKLRILVELVEELLTLFDNLPIDIEFAITSEKVNKKYKKVLWLLQVRPLILADQPETSKQQEVRLKTISEKIKMGARKQPFLMGDRTIYGVMPDWNPAEMIGIRPKPLAISLYRELITDSIWAYQRHNYGYRNLRSFPLMPHFFGLPYIDARLSFNSFIPADLNENLANKLANFYIDRLSREPTLHDKIEFEVVYSCYTLDLKEKLNGLSQSGFTEAEKDDLAHRLRTITNDIIRPENGLWLKDAQKLDVLQLRRKELISSDVDLISKIYWFLEDAKRYGTLPFAGLARAAFIAVQLLNSLVNVGIFTKNDRQKFMESISTVSRKLSKDRVEKKKSEFLKIYGHLRPGSYDILSARYDEAPENYFVWDKKKKQPKTIEPFVLSSSQHAKLDCYLEAHRLETDSTGLLDFMKSAIELRELGKFYFSHNLSDILSLIVQYSARFGLSRKQVAFSDITIFKEIYMNCINPESLIVQSITDGKKRFYETAKLSMPPIIDKAKDIWSFTLPETQPNFITQKQVTAAVSKAVGQKNIENKIVCIPSADPGFDWLFSHQIAGLVTAWGGPNSHMAIRAGELGLPAAIGTGELLYQRVSTSNYLYLDCAGRRLEIIS